MVAPALSKGPPDLFNMATYLLDRHVDAGRGGRVAIQCAGGALTYSDLHGMVSRMANVLAGYGLRQGERCLILVPDSPEFIAAFLGSMRLGAVPVPLNLLAGSGDYRYYLNDSGATTVVLCPEVWPRLESIRDQAPTVRHWLITGDSAPSGCEPLDCQLAQAPSTAVQVPVRREEPSYWLYTSGTTGAPKAVVHRHGDMLACVEPYAREVLRASPEDLFLSASKLHFSYGLVNSLYLPFSVGASVLLQRDKSTAASVGQLIQERRPSLFFAVPTFYAAMLDDAAEHDLSSLRLCVSAGESLPAVIYNRWRQRYQRDILDGLGSTEFGYIFISNRPGEARQGSCGMLIPPHQARVVAETGRLASPGAIGELWVRSGSVAAEYWNKPQQTEQTFVGGWLRTRDLVMLDEAGYYFHCGRADDVMKVSGMYVAPAEVENVLLSHAAVAECAVVGVPGAAGLPLLTAFVIARDGITVSSALAAELQQHARDRLAHYQCPRRIEFVPELPRTVTGKIQRYKLRKEAACAPSA